MHLKVNKNKKEDRTSFAVARLRIHRTHDSVTYSEYKTIRITRKSKHRIDLIIFFRLYYKFISQIFNLNFETFLSNL